MDWLTPDQFGADPRIQKHGHTIRRWCQQGVLKHRRAGRGYLIPASELDRPIVFPTAAPSPSESELTKEINPATIAKKRSELAARADVRIVGKLKPAEKKALVARIQAAVDDLGLADRVSVEA